jgi:hypothetical protein
VNGTLGGGNAGSGGGGGDSGGGESGGGIERALWCWWRSFLAILASLASATLSSLS